MAEEEDEIVWRKKMIEKAAERLWEGYVKVIWNGKDTDGIEFSLEFLKPDNESEEEHRAYINERAVSEVACLMHESEFYKERLKKYEFIKVEVTSQEWLNALGEREEGKEKDFGLKFVSIDDAELGICCEKISWIRDWLLTCELADGMFIHKRDELQKMLDGHGNIDEARAPNLWKIFKQLGLTWNAKK